MPETISLAVTWLWGYSFFVEGLSAKKARWMHEAVGTNTK